MGVGLLAYWLYAIAPEPDTSLTHHQLLIVKDDLYGRVQQLILDAEGLAPGTSGEYKRWTFVMQKLHREFPDRVREFGVVIEAVLKGQA